MKFILFHQEHGFKTVYSMWEVKSWELQGYFLSVSVPTFDFTTEYVF